MHRVLGVVAAVAVAAWGCGGSGAGLSAGDPDEPPVVSSFTATPPSGDAPIEVSFYVSAHDANGSIAKYEWDFEYPGVFAADLDTGTTPDTGANPHNYAAAGTYVVAVRVTDDSGKFTVATMDLILGGNQAPTVSLGAVPTSGEPTLDVDFAAAASDPDGTITLYEWDWDYDGVTFDVDHSDTINTASHSFDTEGVYTVAVRATDDDGAGVLDTATITVANLLGTITIALPASATEGDGVLADQGTVTLSDSTSGDLLVSLLSDDTSELTVPASVTVPSGQTTATFDLTVVDDGDTDGTQTVTVTGTGFGWADGSETMDILDDEGTGTMVLAGSAQCEDCGVRNSDPNNPHDNWDIVPRQFLQLNEDYALIRFDLSSLPVGATIESATLELTVNYVWASGLVTVRRLTESWVEAAATWNTRDGSTAWTTAGGTVSPSDTVQFDASGLSADESMTFDVTAIVQLWSDGTENDGFRVDMEDAGGWVQLAIYESENSATSYVPELTINYSGVSGAMTVDIPGTATEGDGVLANQGTVTLSQAASGNVVVDLLSDDTSELTVAASVTVLDGQTTATFDLTVETDGIVDGPQTVSVSASATGWISGSDTIVIDDNDGSVLVLQGESQSEDCGVRESEPAIAHDDWQFPPRQFLQLPGDYALIKFDLSSLPGGSTIGSATLELTVQNVWSPGLVTVRRLTESWVETSATWNTRDGSTAWTTAGGTVSASDTAQFDASAISADEVMTFDVAAIVQLWSDGTQNDGLRVDMNDAGGWKQLTIFESEHTVSQPRLTIYYQ